MPIITRDVRKLLLLLVLIFGAYAPALQGGYVWDDDQYVTDNALLRSLNGLWRIWFTTETPQYYPLVFTTFWLEHALWGLNPFGYHLVNVLLHATNAWLVWRIFRSLGIQEAWWIGAIFALHPVHVESVAWVTERKNVLSGLLYLLAMHKYLAFEEGKELRAYALAFLLFICALLSKSVTATFPVAILLVLWFCGKPITGRTVARLVPFFLIGAVSGLFTTWLEAYKVGASGPEWELSLLQRFMLAGRVVWFYAFKLVWPAGLVFTYPRWELDIYDPAQYLGLIGTGVLAFALWVYRRRLGSGPAAACLFFALTLAPVLGFVNFYPMRFSFVADHFQYLASLGVVALLVVGARQLWRGRIGAGMKRSWVGGAVGSLLILILTVLTWRQSGIYKDAEVLYRDTLRKNPESWMAHNNLGQIVLKRGEFEGAMGHFRAALALRPKNPTALTNLGIAMFRLGQLEGAMEQYRAALQIDPEDAKAHNNLGVALAQSGRGEEALQHYRAALQTDPDYADAHNNLGLLLVRLGRIDEAIGHYRQALKLVPAYGLAHYNLAVALAMQGNLDETTHHLKEAIRIDPEDAEAHSQLGIILAGRGELESAARHFRRALKIKPDRASAYYFLGTVMAAQGDLNQAVDQFRQALRVDPQFAEAHEGLGKALAQQGQRDEAMRHFEEAIRILKSRVKPASQRQD